MRGVIVAAVLTASQAAQRTHVAGDPSPVGAIHAWLDRQTWITLPLTPPHGNRHMNDGISSSFCNISGCELPVVGLSASLQPL